MQGKLWDVEQRLKSIMKPADRFDELLNGPERIRVEKSIQEIANGGGVQ